MITKNVLYLFGLPSMKGCYFVAGEEGIGRMVQRVDILETPYPEIEQYLEENEFIFTSFWNSKDNKYARIKLVEKMIEKGCAGIAIMPHYYLNDQIDEEIIELGNKHKFPVIFVSETVRWSDIIQEFYESKSDWFYDDFKFSSMVELFTDLIKEKNIVEFCTQFTKILKMPIMLQISGNNYISPHLKEEEKRQLYEYSKSFSCPEGTVVQQILFPTPKDHMFLRCANDLIAVNGYTHLKQASSLKVRCFTDISELFIKKVSQNIDRSILLKDRNNMEDGYYFMVLTGGIDLNSYKYINEHSTVVTYDFNAKYMIVLLGKSDLSSWNVSFWSAVAKIKQLMKPNAIVFSQRFCRFDEIASLSSFFKSNLSHLGCLDGFFTVEEFFLQSLILNVPYQLIERIIAVSSTAFRIDDIDETALETYRLHLMINNLSDVASLLDIHVNTVKYRIGKVERLAECEENGSILFSQLIPIEAKALRSII